MSTITRDELVHVARLAAIDLTEAETDQFATELNVILEAVARVNTIVTPDVPATSHPLPMTNVLRDDVVIPSIPLDEIEAGAIAFEDGKFLVPQILGEE
ncbi:MAG: Asp-tRNA(Asn)/Glu-tRNA(Gln) amidotransferase subunit GatC [Cellulomonadaceae bacterium]|jgi:aspartyl-tRNA(Asn)/glutamyl-tRNA(Gln) amidotransferase subunit C|nr:Asp-tRNA(Asn)/Glu-tRNA(Gln) amidotransferase subunit GatC [Cellulomonadaceae bacterium]